MKSPESDGCPDGQEPVVYPALTKNALETHDLNNQKRQRSASTISSDSSSSTDSNSNSTARKRSRRKKRLLPCPQVSILFI